MIKKLSDQNKQPTKDYYTEYLRIENLFSIIKYVGGHNVYGMRLPPTYTLEHFFEALLFSGWHLRGTYISFADMRESLQIDSSSLQKKFKIESFLLFIQIIVNIIPLINKKKDNSKLYISNDNVLDNIMHNCNYVLNCLNYQIEYDKLEREYYITENNAKATAVGEIFPDIYNKSTEYRRFDLKGNLQRKGEVLCTLYKKLESIENKFTGTTYIQLYKDATFLFNKTGVRHWVEEDKIASNTFVKMTDEELETWYDKTYDLFLSCMIIANYLDMKAEIQEIKQAANND